MSVHFTNLISGINSVDALKERAKSANLYFKEDDKHILIYSRDIQLTGNALNDSIKSIIFEKETLKPIVTQYNKMIYNDDALDFLEGKKWSDIVIKECFEGTMIIVFNSNNKWYVCTRKCLDASKSYWIKDISYYDLFMDTIGGKFTLDDLDKNYSYQFILIHHKNKNIVDYHRFGDRYKTVALATVTEKYTLKKIDYRINDKIIYPSVLKFNGLKDVMCKLHEIATTERKQGFVSTEGYLLEYYNGNDYVLLKLQTQLYRDIKLVKPNVSNLDAMFLELYQEDKLVDVAKYFTSNAGEIVLRIHNAMRNISLEFLSIYHVTRSHKNEELYKLLSPSYKNAIYVIHGLYLQKHSKEIKMNNNDEIDKIHDNKSITVHDVYNTLKKLPSMSLRKIFVERIKLMENAIVNQYINDTDFDTLLQGKLMI